MHLAIVAAVLVSTQEVDLRTYPFSDPDPVPATGERRYPYFRYDGTTDVAETRRWKTVVLDNGRIEVTVMPEAGGKVWRAYDKVAKREFLYTNHVMKFRDIALRGPWLSGGIEFNFGLIGHSPCTSTPVDWCARENADGSASCFVGCLDLVTRTWWQVEVLLRPDADEFETRTVWWNGSGMPAPYYHWMNAAYSLRGDPEFLFPGATAVGHEGKTVIKDWPVDSEGRDVSIYANNAYGGAKSYHVVGGNCGFYGIWWRGTGYGSWHRSRPYEKYGRKIWLWPLSREGGIWEDLLTDDDGQYTELQSGRCFTQPTGESARSPFKHPVFLPGTTETFADRWGPMRSRADAAKDLAEGRPEPRPVEPQFKVDWESAAGMAALGVQSLRERDDAAAEDRLAKALERDPSLAPAATGLAELALRRGQYGRVHELARRVLSDDTYDREANYLDGAAYFAEGDMASARDRLGVAAFSGGWRPAAMALVARSFLREGRLQEAADAAEESLRGEALQLDALLVKAIAMRGRPGRKEFLEGVLARVPLAHAFRYELEGEGGLRRSVRCELPHETYMELASWYCATGLRDDAVRLFRMALPNPVAEASLALLEGREPVFDGPVTGAFPFRPESRKALDAAAARGGWKAKYLAAVLMTHFRETKEAAALLESCGGEPDEPAFYLYRARTRRGDGRMADIRRAIALGGSWRAWRDLMAELEAAGDFEGVLAAARECLARHPGKNPVQIGLANALLKLKRHEECMEYLKGVKILPSEWGGDATGIWHECQKALGQPLTWPENLGSGEPYRTDGAAAPPAP